jgi:hypothetical protein
MISPDLTHKKSATSIQDQQTKKKLLIFIKDYRAAAMKT